MEKQNRSTEPVTVGGVVGKSTQSTVKYPEGPAVGRPPW
jgi:hypothetical protein